jgi:acetyl-CoA carboxylase carboxyltransferase component
MKLDSLTASPEKRSRLATLSQEIADLDAKLKLGGGPARVQKQHEQGKLTARERIDALLDPASYVQEIGLLVAYDQYEGGAPAAGVITVCGRIHGREVVVERVQEDADVVLLELRRP